MRALMAKFPFKADSKADASLQDVNSVFKPKEGAIWKFYDDAKMDKYLQKQGSQFVAIPNTGMTITSSFIAMMNRAAAFTDAAYPSGAADPHVSYTVKPEFAEEQESITLTLDGQTFEFNAGNPSKTYTWPGPSQSVDMAIKYKDGYSNEINGYSGLWDVFRFIQDADSHGGSVVEMKLKTGKSDTQVTHNGKPVVVKLDITPPIFDKSYFAGMGCVAEVAK
jgi:type VI protein secretion system component VasK